jgi:endoglucanase
MIGRMTRALFLGAAILVSAPAAACAQQAPTAAQPGGLPLPSLRVEGNRFVDETGRTVVLRGVSFSDPDRLERAGQWNRAYFEAARSWNANLVRFPVHPQRWRERGEEDYLRLLDEGIRWAGELGMYVIIDWHSIGNLRTELFFRPMYNTTQTETLRFWKTIAERYAGNPVVAFYELFNEPTDYEGRLGRISWAEHRRLMEEIIGVIQAHDRSVISLVAGFDWAYELRNAGRDPIDAPNVAYVTHPYPQKREQPWEPKWEEDFGFLADRFPIVATEFGFMSEDGPGAHVPVIGDETYGRAIIDFFERKGISWTAWVFDPQWSPQLIQGWDFEPTRQGRFFRDRMMQLNPRSR